MKAAQETYGGGIQPQGQGSPPLVYVTLELILRSFCKGTSSGVLENVKGPHKKIPEGSEIANMVANDAKMVAKVAKLAVNLVAKNDAYLALPPRFRQVLIESPLLT
ncbi:hypothetical protein TNCV_1030401 [Trichonephila clavipes]|nr:hypothetical protein TNCV_1030401 [Trichonephila clavipes]